MKRVHDFFDRICPGCEFLPRVSLFFYAFIDQTHSSQESSKEDVVSQELNYFDQLVDTMEKQEKEEQITVFFLFVVCLVVFVENQVCVLDAAIVYSV